MLITSVLTVAFTVISTRAAATYGVGLFIATPFCLGLLATLLYGYRRPRPLGKCLAVAALAVCLPGLLLLVTALEGVACLLMAIPLAVPIALAGGFVGWAMQARAGREMSAAMLLLPVLFSPAVMGAEGWLRRPSPLRQVHSSVEIAAAPPVVWQRVIAFTDIPEPTEWLFRAGIAYPIRARIRGRGAGPCASSNSQRGPSLSRSRYGTNRACCASE